MTLYQQFLRRNTCFARGAALDAKGLMIHSTGADNPNLSRYVPGNEVIGWNTAGNHWDQSNEAWALKYGKKLNKCVHAFIGLNAAGKVATVQTMPWDMGGWHAGHAVGNANYIGVEICEDGLDDPLYFAAVYREAVELAAYLCAMHGWDPQGDGVIICHAEGHRAGVASNHADVLHWFPRHGKTMDDFRADVVREMSKEEDAEMVRYNTVEDIRNGAPWALPTIRRMIDNGDLAGGGQKDANGDPADMDLSLDMIRLLVMLYPD